MSSAECSMGLHTFLVHPPPPLSPKPQSQQPSTTTANGAIIYAPTALKTVSGPSPQQQPFECETDFNGAQPLIHHRNNYDYQQQPSTSFKHYSGGGDSGGGMGIDGGARNRRHYGNRFEIRKPIAISTTSTDYYPANMEMMSPRGDDADPYNDSLPNGCAPSTSAHHNGPTTTTTTRLKSPPEEVEVERGNPRHDQQQQQYKPVAGRYSAITTASPYPIASTSSATSPLMARHSRQQQPQSQSQLRQRQSNRDKRGGTTPATATTMESTFQGETTKDTATAAIDEETAIRADAEVTETLLQSLALPKIVVPSQFQVINYVANTKLLNIRRTGDELQVTDSTGFPLLDVWVKTRCLRGSTWVLESYGRIVLLLADADKSWRGSRRGKNGALQVMSAQNETLGFFLAGDPFIIENHEHLRIARFMAVNSDESRSSSSLQIYQCVLENNGDEIGRLELKPPAVQVMQLRFGAATDLAFPLKLLVLASAIRLASAICSTESYPSPTTSPMMLGEIRGGHRYGSRHGIANGSLKGQRQVLPSPGSQQNCCSII